MKQLRKAIRVCALILAVMVLVPMVYGAYSLLRYGTRWRTSEYNVYFTSMKHSVIPGNIYDRDGVLLVSSNPETGKRVYPGDEALRRSLAHVVGDSRGTVKNAVESFMAEYLYGANMTFPERLKQSSEGALRGDDVTLTLDSGLSAYIASVFPEGKNGAVVVMNYKTGEIYAQSSFPNFDPASGGGVSVSQALNRATRWLSAPGSTFKIVTLASALQNLADVENRAFNCTGGLSFGEHQRTVTDYGGTAHGSLNLRKAFTQSCNSTFASLALELGDKALRRAAANSSSRRAMASSNFSRSALFSFRRASWRSSTSFRPSMVWSRDAMRSFTLSCRIRKMLISRSFKRWASSRYSLAWAACCSSGSTREESSSKISLTRLRFSLVRASFFSASSLRTRKVITPAASSKIWRRSSLLTERISSIRPWPIRE